MNFNALVDAGQKPKVKVHDWMFQKKFTLIRDIDQLRRVVDAAIQAGTCAVDLETEGLDNRIVNGRTMHKIVGYCLCYDGHEGFYVPVGHLEVQGRDRVPHPLNLNRLEVAKEIARLCQKTITIWHNACFDHEFIFGSESKLNIEDPEMFEDTMILDYLRSSVDKQHGLKALSSRFLGLEMIELKELFNEKIKDRDFSTLDPSDPNTLYYAGSDAICTYLLLEFYKTHYYDPDSPEMPKRFDKAAEKKGFKTIYEEQDRIYHVEKALVPALRWLERNRPLIDLPYLERVEKEMTTLIEESVLKIERSFVEGIRKKSDPSQSAFPDVESFRNAYDVKSPVQLGKALELLKQTNAAFASVKLDKTEKSGQVKTTNDAIQDLFDKYGSQFPFLAEVQTFRTLGKALGTYIRPLIENSDWSGNPHHPNRKAIGDNTGRFSFNAWRVDTGRFAASKGRPDHGFIGLNAQAVTACYNYAEIPGRFVYNFPTDLAALEQWSDKLGNHAQAAPEYDRAVQQSGFLRLLHLGQFLEIHKTGEMQCIRPSCEGCPLASVCKRSEVDTVEHHLSIEAGIRPAVRAREGFVLCGIDFGGLELRAAASMSGEPRWIEEFTNGSGDLHKITAMDVYGPEIVNLPESEFKLKRGNGKAMNFTVVYGGGASAVARATGVDREEGQVYLVKMLNGVPVFKKWVEDTYEEAHRNREVETVLGRKIRLPDINSADKWLRAKQERNSVNSKVQGSATGDLIKYAMGSVYRMIRENHWEDVCRMIFTIHDELVFEIRADMLDEILPKIDYCMKEFADKVGWPVQLETDTEFGPDWSVQYDWGKIHTIDSKTGKAKHPIPSCVFGKIKVSEGMWYEEQGVVRVFDGHAWVSEEDYQNHLALRSEATEDLDEEERMNMNIAESLSKDNAKDAAKVPVITKKIDLPVHTHTAHVASSDPDATLHYMNRINRVRLGMQILLRKDYPATHVLEVEDIHGNVLVPKEKGMKINLDAFHILALYEGV